MEVLPFLGVIALIVAGLVLSWWLRAKRREAFGLFALRHGFQWWPTDPFGLLAWPFRLFSRGDGRGIENVVWGAWQVERFMAFDYWYYEESTDSKGHTSRSYRRFSCVQLEVPASFPTLEIAPESVFTRLADAVGLDDIDFELEEFNRRFNVKASERRFAYELIDQRMMRFLMEMSEGLAFEVVGDRVLVYGNRVQPQGLLRIVGVAHMFRERIPRAAWSLYPQAS
jgi:hypothetical protein